MRNDQRVREAEERLFARYSLESEETFVETGAAKVRLRVRSLGSGPPLVFLHGVGLTSAVWAPWLNRFAGYRIHLVDLPGHGLSGPVAYKPGMVRTHSVNLLDGLLDALNIRDAAVLGHSLGGMFALWHAAAKPGRISSLVALGEPGVALPGVSIRMPLSPMTVPVLGPTMLRIPMSQKLYRGILSQGLSPAAASSAPNELVDALRFASRRPTNASTVASLMHAINRFSEPRPESSLKDEELRRISAATLFCWGADDQFFSADQARPSIEKIPSATLSVVPGGHGPWLDSPAECATLVLDHLTDTGFAPAT